MPIAELMSVAAAVAESSEMAGGGLVAAAGKYLAAHEPDKASHPTLLDVKTARSWRGIVAYAPRAGGAYDSHHRTAGIAGRTRRCGGGVAARGERVIGHQGDMFWRAHLKLARQMAGERS